MSTLRLTKTRLQHGKWEGVIEGARAGARPEIKVMHRDAPLVDVDLRESKEQGAWDLSVTIPADAIAEGVQSFVIFDASTDNRLGDFTLIAGDAAADDLRAEVELLRAELDMLKRAFRRHCLETM